MLTACQYFLSLPSLASITTLWATWSRSEGAREVGNRAPCRRPHSSGPEHTYASPRQTCHSAHQPHKRLYLSLCSDSHSIHTVKIQDTREPSPYRAMARFTATKLLPWQCPCCGDGVWEAALNLQVGTWRGIHSQQQGQWDREGPGGNGTWNQQAPLEGSGEGQLCPAWPSLAQPQRPQTWAPLSPRGSSGPKYGAGLARGWYELVPEAGKGVQILLCPLGSYRTELRKASQPPPTGATTHRGRHRLTPCPTLESTLASLSWERGGSVAPLEGCSCAYRQSTLSGSSRRTVRLVTRVSGAPGAGRDQMQRGRRWGGCGGPGQAGPAAHWCRWARSSGRLMWILRTRSIRSRSRSSSSSGWWERPAAPPVASSSALSGPRPSWAS